MLLGRRQPVERACHHEDVGKIRRQLPAVEHASALRLHDHQHRKPDHQRRCGAGGAPHAGAELLAQKRAAQSEHRRHWFGQQSLDRANEKRRKKEISDHQRRQAQHEVSVKHERAGGLLRIGKTKGRNPPRPVAEHQQRIDAKQNQPGERAEN